MAYGKDLNWTGSCDGTPSADPKHGPADMPEPKKASGDDWKGLEDGTPSSAPKPPDKQP